MRVEVTAEDIAKGRRSSCSRCPIARALKRAGFADVSVYNYEFWHGENGEARLPRSAQAFIRRFDDKKPVTPFVFATWATP